MSRYFAGNTLASFFRSLPTVVESTTASRFDSTFVPSALFVPTGSYAEGYSFSATGTVWIHWEQYAGSTSASDALTATIFNGTTGAYRLQHSGPNAQTVQFQYWNGAAWTNLGSTFTLTPTTIQRFDLKIVLNTSFELYLAGSLVTSGSGISGAQTTVTKVRFNSPNTAGVYYSQVMIADFDTRDSRLFMQRPNGDSATHTDGTGSYTDVNEVPLDESTAVALATSGDKRGFTHATLTVPAGYQIGAVSIGGRGRINGSGPSDGKFGLRLTTPAVDYSGSALSFNTGYEPRGAFWETNPNTSSDWTQAGYNDAEIYLEAA